ncbi:hypothetical protein [Halobacillus litoralis]|uniref:hypothetical protein n=1 Tax=Halobacillus litoralis TaxID=45668 RepID=UPI0013E8AB96|nr:hypothetical protein [Halobacillus litoralis]
MKEWVGVCANCADDIYCKNGFLEGVINEDRTLICFSCDEHLKNWKEEIDDE